MNLKLQCFPTNEVVFHWKPSGAGPCSSNHRDAEWLLAKKISTEHDICMLTTNTFMAWEFTQWRLIITVEKQPAQFDHQTNYFFSIVHILFPLSMYIGTQGLPSWVWRLIYRPPLATFQVFPWCILTFPKSITKWNLKTIKIHWKFASKLTKSTPKGTSKTTSSTLAGQAGGKFDFVKIAWILFSKTAIPISFRKPPFWEKG